MKTFLALFQRFLFPRFYIAPPEHQHTATPAVIPANYGRRFRRTAVSGEDYTILATDEYVAAISSITLRLPAASAVPPGWVVILANAAPGSYTVSVVPAGTDTIGDVAGNVSLVNNGSMFLFVSDGVDNWESTVPGS